jgi:alkyl sulfatase BDS1-like metallo-beta-lactamase superfamily hydrolase
MSEPLHRQRPGAFDIHPASLAPARAVAPGIWLSEGLSNSYLIVTSEGRIVVNTGMGFEGPVHRRKYDAIDDEPIRYVILTQGHVDHVGGVGVFLEEGTEVVAQAGNAAHQEDDARIARFRVKRSAFAWAEAITKANRYIREHMGDGVPTQSVAKPTITFEDHLAIELGGEKLELLSVAGGETMDSLAIWMPERRICFTGNLFSALFGHFPNLVTMRGDRYREALKFLAALERVRALEPELLLVGHHEPVEGKERIQEELIRIRDAVRHVHDAVVAGMNEGKDVHTLMAEISLPPHLAIGEGYGKVAWCVRAIWESYAGWFHHTSTTELYEVPARAVHSDVVELAGGPDAVATRARLHAAEGRPLEALHLAEMALAVDPHHTVALEASLAAHHALEAKSENFWETAWLRKQIVALEAARDDGPVGSSGTRS